MLYFTTLYYTELYYTILYYTISHYTTLLYSVVYHREDKYSPVLPASCSIISPLCQSVFLSFFPLTLPLFQFFHSSYYLSYIPITNPHPFLLRIFRKHVFFPLILPLIFLIFVIISLIISLIIFFILFPDILLITMAIQMTSYTERNGLLFLCTLTHFLRMLQTRF